MLYPQNGDRIVSIDSVTSLHLTNIFSFCNFLLKTQVDTKQARDESTVYSRNFGGSLQPLKLSPTYTAVFGSDSVTNISRKVF